MNRWRKLADLPLGACFLHKGRLHIKIFSDNDIDFPIRSAEAGTGDTFRFSKHGAFLLDVEEVELVLPQEE